MAKRAIVLSTLIQRTNNFSHKANLQSELAHVRETFRENIYSPRQIHTECSIPEIKRDRQAENN
jgi:hypothetical protein